jgi:hypothetical protein
MEIVYAAHTETATLMLDDAGVCRWAVSAPGMTASQGCERIVGAQYVASLDRGSDKGLAALPEVGMPMLFAVADEQGRISLVRTSVLLRFEDKRVTAAGLVDELAITPVLGMPAARRRPKLASQATSSEFDAPPTPRVWPALSQGRAKLVLARDDAAPTLEIRLPKPPATRRSLPDLPPPLGLKAPRTRGAALARAT